MKKNVFLVGIISILLVIGFSVTGCGSTTKMVFDENIPEDQKAILLVYPGTWDVIEFSGVPVKWYTPSYYGSPMEVTIPSGQHTVKFNFYYDLNQRFYDKEVTANFEAGHKYLLTAQSPSGVGTSGTYYFHVYDLLLRKNVTLP